MKVFSFRIRGPDVWHVWHHAYRKRHGHAVYYASANNRSMVRGAYSADEAFIFDTKFDDGLPGSGKLFAGGGHDIGVYEEGCTSIGWWVAGNPTYLTGTNNNKKPCILVYFVE